MPIDLLNSIKSFAEEVITQHAGVPDDKKKSAIETITGSAASSLKSLANPESLSGLTSLLTGGGAGGIIDKIKGTVINDLIAKVGLGQSTASDVTSGLLSKVTNLLQSKHQDGVHVPTLLSGLENLGEGGAGGLLKTIGGLFGKNDN